MAGPWRAPAPGAEHPCPATAPWARSCPLSTLSTLTGPLDVSHATSSMEFHLESSGDSLWSGSKEKLTAGAWLVYSSSPSFLLSKGSIGERVSSAEMLKKRNPNNDSVHFRAEEDLWRMQNRNISLSL